MKKILLLLPLLLLSGCDTGIKADYRVLINNKTETHLYCYRNDSLFCDECECWNDDVLKKNNIISFNMTVMPYPNVYDKGIVHYHYCVVYKK